MDRTRGVVRAGPNPDHFVDITDVYPRKLAALEAHTTQTSHMELDARLRTMLGERPGGRPARGPAGRIFNIIRTADTCAEAGRRSERRRAT